MNIIERNEEKNLIFQCGYANTGIPKQSKLLDLLFRMIEQEILLKT